MATGRAVDRDVDDIGDEALSYAEGEALATKNPLILEKATVDAGLYWRPWGATLVTHGRHAGS